MTKQQYDGTRLVDAHGQVHYGRFIHSLTQVNGRDARYLTPMGRPAGRLSRRFAYKQFQYYGLVSSRFMMGCALADTAWLGVAFVYLYDTASGQLHEWSWKAPLARHLSLNDSPRHGSSRFSQGSTCLEMHYNDTPQGLEKRLEIEMPELVVSACVLEPCDFEPMSLCTRSGVNGFTYANKVAGLKATGTLRHHGETHELAALDCYGHHDFTAGYVKRTTWWNWACSSASVAGHSLGFNLSAGVNETGLRENCLWLDGRLIPLGGIHFDYDRERLMSPWRLRDNNGHLDLCFTPTGEHAETLNAAVFASNFHQLFGHFDGHIQVDNHTLTLTAVPGFTEEQYVKW